MTHEAPASALAGQIESAALPITNDLSIVVATVNGSGSQTANMAIMRALFRMGSGQRKNLFPSNIQGLPTWFTIRASDATSGQATLPKCWCDEPETFLEDVRQVPSGGVCFYADTFSEASIVPT
jgi:2-oxoglutarate ferredoxin oxidoreductase subunit alpha